MRTRKNHKKCLKGGKVIGAGGYGCVFKPALKCKGVSERPSGISKLMTEEEATLEYDEIQKLMPILQTIPNNEDYFIATGISMCKPDTLTSEDLEGFASCQASLEMNVYEVNRRLRRLRSLNMIDGGTDLNKYIKTINNVTSFHELNQSLIKLLKFGIVPMNEKGLYHLDVKPANVLIDSSGKCRLIDWGLSVVQEEDFTPESMEDKPVHYNLPIGVVMFNSFVKDIIKEMLEGPEPFSETFDANESRILQVFKYEAHYNIIKDYSKLSSKFDKLVISIIKKITEKYTDNGTDILDANSYFNEVFKHNADVWGFLMIYYDILEKLRSLSKERGAQAILENITDYLNDILEIYIFSDTFATRRYNVDDIIRELSELSEMAGYTITLPVPVVEEVAVQDVSIVPTEITTQEGGRRKKKATRRHKSIRFSNGKRKKSTRRKRNYKK
jgi:serine/threonine protein kinase